MNLQKMKSEFSKIVYGEGIFNFKIMEDVLCLIERLASRNNEISVICDRFECDSVTAILMSIHSYSAYILPDDDDFSYEFLRNFYGGRIGKDVDVICGHLACDADEAIRRSIRIYRVVLEAKLSLGSVRKDG